MNLLVDPGRRVIVAHRGASAAAPENTLPAFERAVTDGADALELDVHVSRDGVPVVIHDATLERTTDLAGAVSSRTAAELRRADAGARFTRDGGGSFPWRGRGARLPTLEEVLVAFRAFPLLIEIKTPAAQHAVRRVIEQHEAIDRCVVASSASAALDAFPADGFLRGASRPDVARFLLRTYLRLPWGSVDFRTLSVPARWHGLPIPTRPFIATARRLGVAVHVWTVDRPAEAAAYWRRGVSGIITNVPSVMRELRGS